MTSAGQAVSWTGRHAVVRMPTEIDLVSSAEVGDLLASVTGESPEVITADLTGTRFCDSAGVRTIARAWERMAASGAELRLVIAGSQVAGVLQATDRKSVV